MKKVSHLFILTMVFGILAVGTVSAQITHYVNPDGICGGNTPCYTTIQAAIIAAAPGDTIIVAAGTYTEKLTVNKAGLTIEGDGSYPMIQPTLGDCTKYDTVIMVNANDVTIRGLDISNAHGVVDQQTCGHIEHHGIWDESWSVGPSGLTVDDCKFHDIEHGVRSYGAYFSVTNSKFYRLGRTGVYASGYNASVPLPMTVKHNWFHDFIPEWKENHAVHVKYDGRVGEVCYNYISGMRMGIGYYYGGPKSGFGDIIFSHNTFDLDYDLDGGTKDMTMGISLWGTGANADNIIIRDNIFANAWWYAIYQEGATISGKILVDNNLFYNNYWYYWPDYQCIYQWFGDDEKAQAGWTGGVDGFNFTNNITVQDPKFVLTGTSPEEQWALQRGSPACNAATDTTNIGAWQGVCPQITPKIVKLNGLGGLNAIYPYGDKKVDKKLEKAIKHVNKSIDGKFWLDDTYIVCKHGHKVFDEEKKAVKELKHLVDKKDTPQEVKDACTVAINNLVAADELLAQKLIDYAYDYGNGLTEKEKEKKQKEIDKAEEEMEKALEEREKGKYDKAIDHYKKAWKHAGKVMGKDCGADDLGV